MNTRLFAKVSMLAIPVGIASCLLLSGTPAMTQSNFGDWAQGQSNSKHCSDRTLFGDYGSAFEGVILAAPGVVLQFRTVGMTHFDGKGNATSVEHTVVDGKLLEPGWTANTGTYTVNPDCTGTAVLNTPNSPVSLNMGFVVVKQGSEVHSVLDINAISGVSIKVE